MGYFLLRKFSVANFIAVDHNTNANNNTIPIENSEFTII